VATAKRQTAVRFSPTAQAILQALTEDTGLSQSAVMELAIRDLARSRGLISVPVPLILPLQTENVSHEGTTGGGTPSSEIPHILNSTRLSQLSQLTDTEEIIVNTSIFSSQDAMQSTHTDSKNSGIPHNEEQTAARGVALPKVGTSSAQGEKFQVKLPLRAEGKQLVPTDVPIPQMVYCGSAVRLLTVARPLAACLVMDEPYMVISIDSPGKDIPILAASPLCVGVLRILFNDISRPKEGRLLFEREHAREILDFVESYLPRSSSILVHCTGGLYRSPAVSAALSTILQGEEGFFQAYHNRNSHVYNTLLSEWRSDPRPSPVHSVCYEPQGNEHWVTADDAAITSFRKPFAFLSNYSNSPVEFEDVEYPTVEHAYQAAKTLDDGWRVRILAASNPDWAKQMSKRKSFSIREGWDQVRLGIMHSLLRQKFSEAKRAQKLLSTGKRHLIEGNIWGDRYWGMCQGEDGHWTGENHLGELLMDVRRELEKNEELHQN
jgi:ribA/ribD-fused uncharacterized protein